MHTERTFRTDGGRDSSTTDLDAIRVSGLACRMKKITVSDDGKLTMAIDATATDNASIARIRDLIMIQQSEVMLTLEGLTHALSDQASH